MSVRVSLRDVIAPSFYGLHADLKAGKHTHYWLKGGRGSTKSSVAAVEVVLGMMQDPTTNAVVLRKVGETIRDSIYEQYIWAVEKLGVSHLWHASLAPLRLTYRPTGQKILFRGADDPAKIKSLKFSKGRLKYVHYEELAEFGSMADIRTINQSLIRGTDDAVVLYTYNPPPSSASWVNTEAVAAAQREDTLVHHSDYRTVPREWLGAPFLADAEHLATINPTKYAHEYLGQETGTGAEVFPNVVARRVTDKQIAMMDRLYRGVDFGFAADPTAAVTVYYNKARSRLVVVDELYQVQLPTDQLAERLKAMNPERGMITADSAEPRTIHDLRSRDIPVMPAKKGPGSVEHGVKWLADLAEIIVDPIRAPNTLRELTQYEVGRDRYGNLLGIYPDKNNHTIDAIRYATEGIRKAWLV